MRQPPNSRDFGIVMIQMQRGDVEPDASARIVKDKYEA
jgi:hypothetical protein